jgi:nucleoside-diphosphate-sugar epimerase
MSARTAPKRTILLTGASGVVGQALLPALTHHRVIGMVRRDNGDPGCETVVGDLTRPRLGLDAGEYHRLAAEIDLVVHSGALTEWGLADERYEAVNVTGTGRVLELADRAGAPIHFISTCFVRALEPGRRLDLRADNVVRPYVAAKLRAEQMLRDSGHPVTIYRPTNLVGDSRTGASSQPQIVQAMSEWICRGRAPYIPSHPGNLVDVVPQDVLAVAVQRAIDADDLGSSYWITYGKAAMTIEETLEICVQHARRLGRRIAAPPVADPARPLPVPLPEVPPLSRSFVRVLLDVSETTAACGGVLPSSLPQLRARHGVEPVSDRDAYRRSLRFWTDADR